MLLPLATLGWLALAQQRGPGLMLAGLPAALLLAAYLRAGRAGGPG